MVKIVTYNVNGLRPRVAQHGSLLRLLNSLDADIICFQEIKLSRQDLSGHLIMAQGYESFVSLNRKKMKNHSGYSGVATFCRVSSAFSSTEVALPVAAEEGFTGVLGCSRRGDGMKKESLLDLFDNMEGLDELTDEDLYVIDQEGRCVITDHGHFVLFNIYGPRAEEDDKERIDFKQNFFKMLQRRWESLLNQGRRVFVVGDLNIAPAAIDDCCGAGPEFEDNSFRKWMRSLFVENGGPFFDVFRAKHPERKEAYTCWCPRDGSEVLNYGTRIDHILVAGQCMHPTHDSEHNFIKCHVTHCDILTQFKRWKPANDPKWRGGISTKLEGSDHVPVYILLSNIPCIPLHNTPSLAARYIPEVHGLQQTIVSLLTRKQLTSSNPNLSEMRYACFQENSMITENSSSPDGSGQISGASSEHEPLCVTCSSSVKDNADLESEIQRSVSLHSTSIVGEAQDVTMIAQISARNTMASQCSQTTKKRARQSSCSQRTLRSFFKSCNDSAKSDFHISPTHTLLNQVESSDGKHSSMERIPNEMVEESSFHLAESTRETVSQEGDANHQYQGNIDLGFSSTGGKESSALLEWKRIQQRMQSSIPLCGHGEPCVARSVKKGPNLGRGFYVCAHPKGPMSNPESSCSFFQWATSSKTKQK
ncbi:Apurinic endonuclease-redox protein [Acorus gramineus]|uniref:DNA-(apurinic or apyrimidinic site) endonuclease 2 n=1 Tax=Acorus gramineus TaxID=55184 RepID=A0AAV9BA76_ACOGR|nr:Apurinic endonuclease-redox protein [Acorus gramineus]